MTEQIDPGAHHLPWTGTRAETGQPTPGPGTWEVVDHEICPGDGTLVALGRGEAVPPCPLCDAWVTWQLSHLSANVATDHRHSDPLP